MAGQTWEEWIAFRLYCSVERARDGFFMIDAVLRDPDNDGPRLVLADWLDEHRRYGADRLREPGFWYITSPGGIQWRDGWGEIGQDEHLLCVLPYLYFGVGEWLLCPCGQQWSLQRHEGNWRCANCQQTRYTAEESAAFRRRWEATKRWGQETANKPCPHCGGKRHWQGYIVSCLQCCAAEQMPEQK